MNNYKNIVVNSILDRIKVQYGLSTDLELSAHLGIKQPRLALWRSRGTIDIFIIIDKCRDSDLHWLLTGEERAAAASAPNEKEELIKARERIEKLEAQIEVLKDMLAEERNKQKKESSLKRSGIDSAKIIERK